MTNTWVVQTTVTSYRRGPADQNAANELTAELQLLAGCSGEPGVDPQAAFLGCGRIRVRQTFPLVTPQQAVNLATDRLRRWIRPEDIVRIEAMPHADWLEKERRRANV
ncbi:hypothetical protein ACWDUC_14135 [Streptomyces tricolor]